MISFRQRINFRHLLLFAFFCLCGGIILAQESAQRESFSRNKGFNLSSQKPSSPTDERSEIIKWRLCRLSRIAPDPMPNAPVDFDDSYQHRQLLAVERGIKNAQRILPLAKRLAVESLNSLSSNYGVNQQKLSAAVANINAVDAIILDTDEDDAGGETAWVSDDDPTIIHVGSHFALDLIPDEGAVYLLGHELTHAAAMNGALDEFTQNVARRAVQDGGIEISEDQEEDLACDFIGEQILKRFIRAQATNQTPAMRLARALDYSCYAESDVADDEHLSENDTLRALIALDPELGKLILGE